MSEQQRKQRTITLTGRAPVKIYDDEWPEVAVGEYTDHDNQYECQANRKWKMVLRVRQHTDGRAIVYGVYEYRTAWQGERNVAAKAGLLLGAEDDIAAAISTVGETIADAASEAGYDFGAHVSEAVRDCIADLPAEQL